MTLFIMIILIFIVICFIAQGSTLKDLRTDRLRLREECESKQMELDELHNEFERRDDANWRYRADKEIEVKLEKYKKSHHYMQNLSYQVRDINKLLNTNDEEFVNK